MSAASTHVHSDSPDALTVVWRFAERSITPRTALPLALLMTLAAGVGDLLTPAEASFTLFYVIPLAVATWFRSKRAGYAVIAEIMAVSGVADMWFARHSIPLPFVLWNLGIELGLYVLFATLLDALKKRVQREAELRQGAIEQLRHAERLNTLGKLAAGIAHELGTPMNVISGRAGLIVADASADEEARSSARIIVEQVARMTAIIRNLLEFARRGGARKKTADLTALCRDTVALVRPLANKQGVDIRVLGGPLKTQLNPSEIQQVLSNLITNAIHAVPEDGHVEVSTRIERGRSQGTEQEFAVVTVRDDGQGIAPDVLPLIFDPFFTTKDVGEGTGLGLSVSYGIVRDHGGFIRVKTRLGGGTSFLVYLPR